MVLTQIVDLEEGIIQLKEDLIQERADARMEKKRLKKAVVSWSSCEVAWVRWGSGQLEFLWSSLGQVGRWSVGVPVK